MARAPIKAPTSPSPPQDRESVGREAEKAAQVCQTGTLNHLPSEIERYKATYELIQCVQNPQWRSRLKKDPGIPNLFPYKDKILHEIEEKRRLKEEEAMRRREEARARDRGLEDADEEDLSNNPEDMMGEEASDEDVDKMDEADDKEVVDEVCYYLTQYETKNSPKPRTTPIPWPPCSPQPKPA
jgi:hypothetical protein